MTIIYSVEGLPENFSFVEKCAALRFQVAFSLLCGLGTVQIEAAVPE